METLAALPRDIWERTPPEAQAYIGTLEARVATLEDMVRTLQEQRNQSSRNSSRPPSSDPPLNPMECAESNKSHSGTTAPDPVATDGLIRINSKDPDGNIVEFVERS